MTGLVVAALVAAVVVFSAWAYFTAQRLDRLHIRLDRSRDALQAALDRRCAVIAATLPALAGRARAVEEIRFTPTNLTARCAAEDALRGDVGKYPGLPKELVDADARVMLALRFYNDAVRDTRAVRLGPAVRALRLAGTAALPEYASLSALHESDAGVG